MATIPSSEDEARYERPVLYQQAYFNDALRQEIDKARGSGVALSVIFLSVTEFSRGAAQRLLGFAEQLPSRCFLGLLSSGDYAFGLPGANIFQANAVADQLLGWLEDFDANAAVMPLVDALLPVEAPRVRRRQGRMGPTIRAA
jgi:hypothetical protein